LKILILEYAVASGIDDPSLTVEGRAMLTGLLNDFDSYSPDFLISEKSNPLDSRNCQPIKIQEDPLSWIQNTKMEYDACLPIAPEENMISYEITKSIENKGWMVLGSSSDAVKTCSDKWETYKTLKDKVPFARTQKLSLQQVEEETIEFEEKMVVKPADGVSCTSVQTVDSMESFILAAEEIKKATALPYLLIQKYLEGTCVSVSLLSDGDNVLPLSLNLQNIELHNSHMDYHGGKVPYRHPKIQEAYKAAKKALKSIKGIKGYVGVDMILNDEINILEINSRLTTSYVALRELLDFNLGQSILESCQGKLPKRAKLNGVASFKKVNDIFDLKVIR
jgi:predicted ATP-grasp superfamily ATP-dependent carboligase